MAIIKIVNEEGGSDARYDVSQMTEEERQGFDSEGRPLGANNPDQYVWTPGLPGARGGTDESHMGMDGSYPGGDYGGGAGPYYAQLKSMLQADSAADLSNTQAAIRQALIAFGLVPDNFEDPLKAVDDLTRSLAGKNTESGISTYARMLEQKQDDMRSMIASLTGRGLRRSGARGYGLRRGQLNWDRGFQDALAQILRQTGGLYSTYASNERQRQMQLLAALMNSYQGGGRRPPPSSPAPPAPAAPAPPGPPNPSWTPDPGDSFGVQPKYGLPKPWTGIQD